MDEQILAAVFRRDESIALFIAEPLDCTLCHTCLLPVPRIVIARATICGTGTIASRNRPNPPWKPTHVVSGLLPRTPLARCRGRAHCTPTAISRMVAACLRHRPLLRNPVPGGPSNAGPARKPTRRIDWIPQRSDLSGVGVATSSRSRSPGSPVLPAASRSSPPERNMQRARGISVQSGDPLQACGGMAKRSSGFIDIGPMG